MSMELNKALELLREIRPSIPKEVLELWCKDRDAFLASHPAVEQAGGDERAAFELFVRKHCGMPEHIAVNWDAKFTNDAWEGWQARAALAQPSPAQAEAERPEVVAYLFVKPDGTLSMDAVRHKPSQPAVAIMTVAQHERIVGELRADRDSWAEQAEQRLADWDEMRKERDAALAEVERLRESKGDPVGSLEKCMKVMYERDEHAKRLEVALARVAELEGKLTDWVHEGFRLNEALAVAKAQHSVPDDDMILQIFADNAEHSEQGDEHGYCIVREQHAQAIARKLLAAAPGNSAQHSVPEEFIGRLSEFLAQRGATGKALLRELRDMLAAAPGKEVGHE
ncbi:TPA: hypothetical protein ACU6E9_003665 [Pseudomonas aeruginosa]